MIPDQSENVGLLGKRGIKCLAVATVFLFLGRALQHFFQDVPYRIFFWDQNLIPLEGEAWDEWANHRFSEAVVEGIGVGIAWFFLLGILVCLLRKRIPGIILKVVMWTASMILLLISLLYFKDHFFRIAQLIEYTLQWTTPLLFLFAFVGKHPSRTVFLAKVAIALTFLGHGMYALGIYPVPVHFIDMTMGILGVGEQDAKLFLTIAGIMDILVAIGLFIPGKWSRAALLYAFLWGMLTAFARLAHVSMDGFYTEAIVNGLPGTLYRFPHGLVPLALLFKKK